MYEVKNKLVIFKDLGTMDYQEAWDYQTQLLKEIVDTKLENRNSLRSNPESTPITTPNYLLLCNHPPVYTLGKSGSFDHLLLNQTQLENQKIQFYKINRGGDITYHGPGQVVGYPIMDLENFFTDVHKYMRFLEEVIIRTLADYGLQAGRIAKMTGVWLDYENPFKARKICAMGVRFSRWVSMHGWAFNINTNLDYFNNIIPCGIQDKGVTSLHKELGVEQVDLEEVKERLKHHFEVIFEAILVG